MRLGKWFISNLDDSQRKIILQSIDDDIIVQGVAGSGKTNLVRAFQLIRTNAPKQPMALFSTRPEMCAQMRKSPSLSEKCSDLGRRYTKHASRQGREYTKRLSERTMLTGSRLQQNYMPSSLQPKLRHSPYECQRKAGVSR